MLIGYARISTTDQTLDLQKDALQKAGCDRIFTDIASGAKAVRKGLDEALSYVRPGDILVVWRLDRLGRSLRHLIETITALNNRKIGFKSITESIDTTTSGGKLIFHIFGACPGGRRRPPASPKKVKMAQALYRDKNNTIEEICRTLNISRATLYRYIKVLPLV